MDDTWRLDALKIIDKSSRIVILQAENPDGDSLGSSLALEALLMEQGKRVTMYCAIAMPKYLHYIEGWSRVTNDFPYDADLAIIVDASSKSLFEKAFTQPNLARLSNIPVIIFDHHSTESDLPFSTINIIDSNAVATGQLLTNFAEHAGWDIPHDAAEALLASILSDSLGLTTDAVNTQTLEIVTVLLKAGARISVIEEKRREYMRKPADILAYKGRLLERIEYLLDGTLAIIHIPWEEIQEFSDRYNPSILVLEEMRLVENVRIAVAFKTYPDGRITGKLRANSDAKVCHTIAGYFGGGGHPLSAGFKVYGETLDTIKREMVDATDKALIEYDKALNV
jgi:phosphoesterase RecJ-like protein